MRNTALRDERSTREADAKRNMVNRKPYRTAEQKKLARSTAEKVNGRFVSKAPFTLHSTGKRKDHSK